MKDEEGYVKRFCGGRFEKIEEGEEGKIAGETDKQKTERETTVLNMLLHLIIYIQHIFFILIYYFIKNILYCKKIIQKYSCL